MNEEKNNGVNLEVEKRLESLFGDSFDEESVEDEPQVQTFSADETGITVDFEENDSSVQDTSIRELKSIVLSLDWEITDELMKSFISQVDGLKEVYKGDKLSFLLLSLLEAIGRYIKAKKGKAHPDAIKILHSEFGSLEKLVNSKGATEQERKRILLSEVRRFRELKEKITSRTAQKSEIGGDGLPTKKKPVAPTVNKDRPHSCKDCLRALEEMKRFVKDEFDALKAELKQWKAAQEGKK